MHAALCIGVTMFGIVGHFVLLPSANASGKLAPLVPVLLALALGLCAVAMLLMKRVPRPASGETASAFWSRASQPAILTWTPLEAAGLLSVMLHAQTGSTAAIVVGVIAVLILVLLRPAYFERR